jgi:hypothetical protein
MMAGLHAFLKPFADHGGKKQLAQATFLRGSNYSGVGICPSKEIIQEGDLRQDHDF